MFVQLHDVKGKAAIACKMLVDDRHNCSKIAQLIARRLHPTRYSQRWQAETVNSMLKRLMGSGLRARNYWSQCRETILRAISLNVMILKRKQVSNGADLFAVSARFAI